MNRYVKYSDWQENSGYIHPNFKCNDASKSIVRGINSTAAASDGKGTKEEHADNKRRLKKLFKTY